MRSVLKSQTEGRPGNKRWWFLLSTVVVLLALFGGWGYWHWQSSKFIKASQAQSGPIKTLPNKVNILLLGVMEQAASDKNAEVLVAITIDTSKKKVFLFSLPLESRVKIPGGGWNTLQYAYVRGGRPLLQRAAENLLGIPQDYYFLVDFAGLVKIVDAVGGVQLTVAKRMYYADPIDGFVVNLQPGEQLLTGQRALQYVRYRDEEGDNGRIKRQQQLFAALLRQICSPEFLPRLPELAAVLSSSATTDLKKSEMLQLAQLLQNSLPEGPQTAIIPGSAWYFDGGGYWLPDVEVLREQVSKVQELEQNVAFRQNTRETIEYYDKSMPTTTRLPAAPTLSPNKPQKPEAGSPAAPEKLKSAEPGSPAVDGGKLQFSLINASDNNGAAEKMVTALRGAGYEANAAGRGATRAETLLVIHVDSPALKEKLASLPFRHIMQLERDEAKAEQVQVFIGQDYLAP